MFRISAFAALTRVSTRMLRHYDALGLLTPELVDPRTGYRLYAAAQLPRLNRIIALRELGFGLDEIARLVDEQVPVAQLRELLTRRRAELRQRMNEDQLRLARVEARIQAVETDERHPLGEVVLRAVEEAHMATIRDVVPSLGQPVERLFDELEGYAARHRARADRHPLLVFHTWARTPHDVEVAVPITRSVPASPRVQTRAVAGAPEMACLVYTGGYHQTAQAVETLRSWAETAGRRIAGEIREVYLRFGADERVAHHLPKRFLAQRVGDYVTEVQVPVVGERA